jgi:endoglucanase
MATLKQLLIIGMLLFYWVSNGQTPFTRGFNLANWFQAPNAGQIQLKKYTRQDFEKIKSLGCDVIRLPINLHPMTSGPPEYLIDPLLLEFLDTVVDWAESVGINIILDNHTFDPNEKTDPAVEEVLVKVWEQMAHHFKDRSQRVFYEVLNEPHGISNAVWGAIQGNVISTIRSVDSKHTIIVGGTSFNSYNELNTLPLYADTNLIYTFHFYDPFVFTHQGASWVNPSMVPLKNVPFPYNSAEMPDFPASLKGSWIESAFKNYNMEGNADHIRKLLDVAVKFRDNRKVNIFCGELGVLRTNVADDDRVRWYDTVRTCLENNNIAWASWDYQGGFGIFEAGTDELFEHDLNNPLLEALGLNIPPKDTLVVKPDSVGFTIYTDGIEEKIRQSGYTSGAINYYSPFKPNNGKYSLHWENPSRYNAIGFDFVPNKDLSRLRDENYALDFIVKGSVPNTGFSLRFIDTKTSDPDDHPWRMNFNIDENHYANDGKWHHLHIPLTQFKEQGSWDNNTWYNPEGKFDWTKIDKLEITIENNYPNAPVFWFDNIHITNKDTASIYDTTGIVGSAPVAGPEISFRIYPNPVQGQLFIKSKGFAFNKVEITGLSGNVLFSKDFDNLQECVIDNPLQNGFYIVTMSNGIKKYSKKMIIKRD